MQVEMSRSIPTKPGTPWSAIFSLITALAYGVSPIDLLPDIIPIIGILDDALIVPFLIIWSIVLFARHRKQTERAAHIIDLQPVQKSPGEPVIPNSYEQAAGQR